MAFARSLRVLAARAEASAARASASAACGPPSRALRAASAAREHAVRRFHAAPRSMALFGWGGDDEKAKKDPEARSADEAESEAKDGAADESGEAGGPSASDKAKEAAAGVKSAVGRRASFAWEVLKESVGLGSAEEAPEAAGSAAADYPWVEYAAGGGKMMYRNRVTGKVQEEAPDDFAKYGRSLEVDTETMALTIAHKPKTRWDRYRQLLSDSPLMRAWDAAAETVASTEAAQRLADAKEDAQTQWETSQSPLVYRAASAYDAVFGETEQARAVAQIQELDPRFDGGPAFVEECRGTILPSLVSALLRGDRVELDGWCTDECMARVNAVLRAREAEALTVDATILSTSQVTMAGAKLLENGPPIVMVTGMVQQLHCIRNKEGEVVEGSEDEIRAVMYALGLQRAYLPEKGGLVWQVCELSYTGGQLYL